MANAKKCDKCGKLYEIAEKKTGLNVFENYEDEGRILTRAIDLCEECEETIHNIINEEE